MTLATLALLAAVTRPVWASGTVSRDFVCMGNDRRLAAGWLTSINDPLFFVPNSATNLPDFPGSPQDGACWFTFADGHLELRDWESVEFRRPVRLPSANNVPVSPGNPDVQWLLEHTPRR